MTTIDADRGTAQRDDAMSRVADPGTAAVPESVALLLQVLRLRDPHLADHGLRSAQIAAAIAVELGAGSDETSRTFLGGLLHDVGKLGVEEAILWKAAPLDAGEWVSIRSHPALGHRLVAGLVDEDVAAVVLHHHERIDGDGYPHGVPLGGLPTTVRIVQVADAYDALTSDRPYAPPVPRSAAMAEITRCAGTQFDPEIVDTLARMLAGGVDEDRLAVSWPPDPGGAGG